MRSVGLSEIGFATKQMAMFAHRNNQRAQILQIQLSSKVWIVFLTGSAPLEIEIGYVVSQTAATRN